jgi:hypothetical protein
MTFGVPRWAVAGLESTDIPWAVIEPMWEQLRTPYEHDPRLGQATAGQRAVYALHWLWSEVDNGGLEQYLWNPSGMLAEEAIQGARLVGATAYAELLAEATTAFGSTTVPKEQPARRRVLEELTARQRRRLAALDERWGVLLEQQPLGELLEQYVQAHPWEFFLDEGELDPAAAAQAQLELAYRLVTRGQPGDLERARPLLRQAQASARALGVVGIEGRCRSLLDQLDTLPWR